MPEIPEIETLRKHLARSVEGKKIAEVEVSRPKTLNTSPELFQQALIAQEICQVQRRAKILVLSLTNTFSFIVHFMLEGFVRFYYKNEIIAKRPSILLGFDNGERLAFFKMNLGYIHLVPTADLAQTPELAALGPEPLSPAFTYDIFNNLLQQHKGMIKPLLIDQKFIAGIGNVYSNEVLFCSQILPTRKSSTLSEEEKQSLYQCIRRILNDAINYGGVYEEKFSSDDTITGGYTPHLQVAYRTGEPCYVCGTPIQTKRVGGRNAFFCPVCQH